MCEFTLTTMGIPEDLWPFAMGRALTGNAAPLWSSLVSTNDPAVSDYKLFKEELRTNFGQEADLMAHFNLLELAQGNLPFSVYAQKFGTLSTGVELPPPFDVIFFATGLNRREKATVLKLSSVKAATVALRAEEIARRDAPSTSSGFKYNKPQRAQRNDSPPAARTGFSRPAQLNAIATSAASFPAGKRLTAELREFYEVNGCKYCRTTEHMYANCRHRRDADSHARAAGNGQRQ
jgi:hypothetical protein